MVLHSKNGSDIKLREVANRVISERGIESCVFIDTDALDFCSKFVDSQFQNGDDDVWFNSLMASAILKYRPIQRLNLNIKTTRINDIFALTLITDVFKYKLTDEEHYPREKSGAIARQILKYFIDGSNDPHAILCMIRYMNHIV